MVTIMSTTKISKKASIALVVSLAVTFITVVSISLPSCSTEVSTEGTINVNTNIQTEYTPQPEIYPTIEVSSGISLKKENQELFAISEDDINEHLATDGVTATEFWAEQTIHKETGYYADVSIDDEKNVNADIYKSLNTPVAAAWGETTVEETSWGYLYNLENGDIIEVGDSTTTDFKANVKAIRQTGLCWFSLGWLGSTFEPSLNGDVVSFAFSNDINVSIYPVAPCERLPEGGIEYDISLAKKPAKPTVTLDVDWNGITWEKILPLDEVWTEETCQEQWGVEDAPYSITQTDITGNSGEIYKHIEEYEVNSYLGKATEPTKRTSIYDDISHTSTSRSFLYIHRGVMTDALNQTAWVEDITLDEQNKQITFDLPSDWLKFTAEYPVNQVCGVDPAYTEDIDALDFSGMSDAQWNADYDLYTNEGVPKGAVAEIMLENQQKGTENTIGVRTDGSSLNRYVDIHECEPTGGGSGDTHCRMFVLCDESTGYIDVYTEDVSDLAAYCLGYWENVSFTEDMIDVTPGLTTTWQTEFCGNQVTAVGATDMILYSGNITRVGGNPPVDTNDGTIISITWFGYITGSPTGTVYCRVRDHSTDALLETIGSVDVSTLGSSPNYISFDTTPYNYSANDDVKVTIEYDGGDASNYLNIKYYPSSGYSVDLYSYDGSWNDLSPYSPNVSIYRSNSVNKVAHIVIENQEEDANTVGVRAYSSSLTRYILLHEAEGGGSTCIDMFVKPDSDAYIKGYTSDPSNTKFTCFGTFGSELDFVELWQQITNDGDSDWDAADLTAYLDEDGRVVDYLLTHGVQDANHTLGVRDGDDSSTARYLIEHEAEGGGSEWTGYSMSAQTNASGVVNLYSSTSTENFYLTGYFKPAGAAANISNTPDNENIGLVSINSTYYAGEAPSNPVHDDNCTFSLTNNSGANVTCTILGTNATGGVGHTLTSDSPLEDEIRVTVYASGDDPDNDGIVINTTAQEFLTNFADNTTIKWDFKLETGTTTDGVQKTFTITLEATLS